MFCSSCLLAMDTGFPSVMEVFELFIGLDVWDVLRVDDTGFIRFTIHKHEKIFPKTSARNCSVRDVEYVTRFI